MKVVQGIRRLILRWYYSERIASLSDMSASISVDMRDFGATFAKVKGLQREFE